MGTVLGLKRGQAEHAGVAPSMPVKDSSGLANVLTRLGMWCCVVFFKVLAVRAETLGPPDL